MSCHPADPALPSSESAVQINAMESMAEVMALEHWNVFLYFPQSHRLWFPLSVADRLHIPRGGDHSPERCRPAFVAEQDRDRWLSLFTRLDAGERCVTGDFSAYSDADSFTVSVTACITGSDGLVLTALGRALPRQVETAHAEHLAQSELQNRSARSNSPLTVFTRGITSLFYAVFVLNLPTNTFVCYRETFADTRDALGHCVTGTEAMERYIDQWIEPEFRPVLRDFTDLKNVSERFRDNDMVSLLYRRKDIGWVRGSIIAVNRQEDGTVTDVIFTVSDVAREMALREKAESAEYAARHDPLTGVLNRKAFESLIEHPGDRPDDIGLMLVDIDRFKEINDTYGHETGDRILKRVGSLLDTLYPGRDNVIRLGGDEFAVLIDNTSRVTWAAHCDRLQTVCAALQGLLPDGRAVTLSCGVAQTAEGFSLPLYRAADRALYHTKNLGRAGCSLIDAVGEITRFWRDPFTAVSPVLSQSRLVPAAMEALLRNSDQLLFIKDRDLRYVACTEPFARIAAVRPSVEEVVGQTDRDLVDDPALVEKYNRDDRRMLESGETRTTYRETHPAENGRAVVCETVKYLITDAQGRPAGIFGMIRDLPPEEPASCAAPVPAVIGSTLSSDGGIDRKEMLAQIFDNMPGGIVLYRWDGHHIRPLYISAHFARLWGTDLQRPEGVDDFSLVHPADREAYKAAFSAALDRNEKLEYTYRVWSRTLGHYFWIRASTVTQPQEDGTKLIYATYSDVSEQRLQEQKLRYASEHDPLTGLYNRTRVFDECRRLLAAYPDTPWSMVHLDVRQFRLFNTFFGEEAGNELLCHIADLLRKLRPAVAECAYGRIDADIFCLFCPSLTGMVSSQFRTLLRSLEHYRDGFPVVPRIGIWRVTDASMPVEAMFARANAAAATLPPGSGRFTAYFDEAMERRVLNTQLVTKEMRGALEDGQFKVWLQPKMSLETGRTVGAEALVRWQHPVRGLQTPDKFIPVFESNGFITQLDRYMWEQACVFLAKRHDEGKPQLPVSVNVSRISMYDTGTVAFLKDLVTRYGLEPRMLELELTESAYVSETAEMSRMLKDLRAFGFRILIDDFGKGYSALNMLKSIAADTIKLDMDFLPKAAGDTKSIAVVAAVIVMSRELGMEVIAEGVETPEQAEILKRHHCPCAQGYLFAKPMPAEQFEDFAKAH